MQTPGEDKNIQKVNLYNVEAIKREYLASDNMINLIEKYEHHLTSIKSKIIENLKKKGVVSDSLLLGQFVWYGGEGEDIDEFARLLTWLQFSVSINEYTDMFTAGKIKMITLGY